MRGGASQVLPLQHLGGGGEGAEKVLKSFEVILTQLLEILAILTGGTQNFTLFIL